MKKIAHRCGRSAYPAETVAAARYALSNGADMVEVDIRFTADEKIVVSHSSRAERNFGVDRFIRDMTLPEFCALSYSDAPGYQAQSLEDFLKAGIAPLLLHVKEGGKKLNILLDLLRAYHYEEHCVIGLVRASDVAYIKESAPAFELLGFLPEPEAAEVFSNAGAGYIRLWESWLTPERIKKIHDLGKAVWVMTGDCGGNPAGVCPSARQNTLAKMGVDAILLDEVK